MSRLALLFPGQGAQRVGMGAALAQTDGAVLDGYFALAEDVCGLPIGRLCREGPLSELTRTEVSQPALLAVSLALADVARDVGLEPAWVAGHSLGEYAAAVVAGALSPQDGMAIVVRRSRLMAEVQAARPGMMAAVIGLGAATTAALCARVEPEVGPVVVANLNTDDQIVVSGVRPAVERLRELARAAGGRAVALPVGGAFHSPLMEPVRAAMATAAAKVDFRRPRVPLVVNVSATPLTDPAAIREALVEQISYPVRWVDCMRTLREAGCKRLVELGSGVLTGLARSAQPDLAAAAADGRRRLEALASGSSAPVGE